MELGMDQLIKNLDAEHEAIHHTFSERRLLRSRLLVMWRLSSHHCYGSQYDGEALWFDELIDLYIILKSN